MAGSYRHDSEGRSKLSKVIPRSLPQEVAARILLQIVNDEYPPGTQLPPENELAESFGVSRIVTREAMRILSARGVVAVRQGRNTAVNPIDRWNLLDPQVPIALFKAGKLGSLAQDIVDMRKMLEVEAAGLAARRATEEDRSSLRELLGAMIENTHNSPAYVPLEDGFHGCVWRAANNVLLLHLLNTLDKVFICAKEFIFDDDLPDRDREHCALSEAIERHDSAAARDAMGRDIARFDEELRLVLEGGPKSAATARLA